MKRIIATTIVLAALVLLVSATFAANGTATLRCAASDTTLSPGDEVTLTVALGNSVTAKSILLTFAYDTDVFALPAKNDGLWSLSNTDIAAFTTDRVPCGAAAAAFGTAATINGTLFTLKLHVKEDAAPGDSTVTVTPTIKNGTETLDCGKASLTLTVAGSSPQKWDVTLQAPDSGDESVSVSLTNGDTVLEPDDSHQFQQVAGGSYTLCASKDGFVSYEKEITIDENTELTIPTLVQRGNVNGAADYFGNETSVEDMACLYTFLAAGVNEGQINDADYFRAVADVNEDGAVNILDYQALYAYLK